MSQECVSVNKDGVLTVAAEQPTCMTAMLPSDYPQNHAANLLCLPNGDLLCAWFAGTQEGVADISILCARLQAGSNRWDAPVRLSDDPTRSEQNPVLFLDPKGTLWLLWTAQVSGNQDTAIVRYRQSQDGGISWGEIATLIDDPGTFIRQPIVVLPSGRWLLPVFYCTVPAGEKWVGHYDTSGVHISDDEGKTWRKVDVPDSLGCVHMCITPLHDGRLIALFRSRWADAIYQSFSDDEGLTWCPPVATALPNNNSSIQVTTLHNGDLALVYNPMSAAGATERRRSLYDEIEDDSGAQEPEMGTGRSAFWGAPRAPMSLAISKDNGQSWQTICHLDEGDGYCMTNNSQQRLNREFSYPTVTQGPDGALHIAYTYFRQAIKYVRYPVTDNHA
ncbi:sialidase family protein [Vibrio rhizosphaerae]|uniref:sialidase family protein n=1 Tax=Vibrio rhizosphaerae TaxID=398736 RepID=UPI00056F7062|nr:sialidase family protein [Vibrio rhizosphaerae]